MWVGTPAQVNKPANSGNKVLRQLLVNSVKSKSLSPIKFPEPHAEKKLRMHSGPSGCPGTTGTIMLRQHEQEQEQ